MVLRATSKTGPSVTNTVSMAVPQTTISMVYSVTGNIKYKYKSNTPEAGMLSVWGKGECEQA